MCHLRSRSLVPPRLPRLRSQDSLRSRSSAEGGSYLSHMIRPLLHQAGGPPSTRAHAARLDRESSMRAACGLRNRPSGGVEPRRMLSVLLEVLLTRAITVRSYPSLNQRARGRRWSSPCYPDRPISLTFSRRMRAGRGHRAQSKRNWSQPGRARYTATGRRCIESSGSSD